jgi:hypothetical protein
MNVIIASSVPPATVAQIHDFELEKRIALPLEYRQFLQRWNGGRPTPAGFQVPKWPGEASLVGDFFGIRQGEACSLSFWSDELQDRLKDQFIAIADDPGGNFICMGIAEGNRGKIYYWDASPDWGLTAETGTMFLVADNIDDFVAKLGEL